ncbi:MAG: hypothetical protein Q9167_007180 [Letrouitia subvulpina]
MANLSRFHASAISGIQETQIALASVNFDFSLFKVETPTEYQGLGRRLSRRRREAAEQGSEHIIARKLGALFAHDIPDTPNLFRAYGLRATEIADLSPQGSTDDGAFQDWTGADATSIWAAATSGREAIAMHLLACMLARVWSASEATSIWDEIVEVRKKELMATDSNLGFSAYFPNQGGTTWLQYLAEAAETYVTSVDMQRRHIESLIARGRRRHGYFLADPKGHPSPMFGISNVSTLIRLVKGEERRVELLRLLASSFETRADALLIRYKHVTFVESLPDGHLNYSYDLSSDNLSNSWNWEYATALPACIIPQKRVPQKRKF